MRAELARLSVQTLTLLSPVESHVIYQGLYLSFTGSIYSSVVLNFFPKIGKIIAPFQWRSGFSKKVIVFVCFWDSKMMYKQIKSSRLVWHVWLFVLLSGHPCVCAWCTCWQAGRLPLGGTESNRFWARETICVSRISSLSVLTTVAWNRLALTSGLKPHWWISCELVWFSWFMEKTIF